MHRLVLFLTVVWTILIGGESAHAYLDPGSTSMIWQLLLGALATVVVFLKVFWHKLTALFGSSNKKAGDSETAENEDLKP